MPLSMMKIGERKPIVKITGKDDTKRFLENLGFTEGSEIMIISVLAGNMIVNVKESRVAIDKSMANRIIV
ncbi:MAG: FeoA family protein [Eubacteriales bacterium]|nr:FeoA family protein [Eubacteriales bacterium]